MDPGKKAIIDALSTALVQIQASRYLSTAGYVILLYDMLLLLPDEVRLIWRSPFSLVKFLFYLNRILCPLSLTFAMYHLAGFRGPLDASFCRILLIVNGSVEIIGLAACNWLLLLRLSALYHRKKAVMIPLYTFYVATYITAVTTTGIAMHHVLPTMDYSLSLKVCSAPERPPLMGGIWVAPIGLEIIIFLMTVYKGWTHAREMQIQESPIMHTLYRDGILYFSVIIVLRVANMFIWLVLPPAFLYLGLYFLWAMVTVLVSRFFINLKAAAQSDDEWASASMKTNGVLVSNGTPWAPMTPTTMKRSTFRSGMVDEEWAKAPAEDENYVTDFMEMKSYR